MQKPEKSDPDALFVEAMAISMAGGHPSQAIENQEARGQRQLVMSDSIPSSWGSFVKEDEACRLDDILTQLGFEVGKPFEEDSLFRPAKLPDGWKKAASNHSMHSGIFDDQGFARIGIFYKAAFYDRGADMHFKRRINVTYDPRHTGERDKKVMAVTAKGKGEEVIILASFPWDLPDSKKDHAGFCAALDGADREASDWINKRYPDHMNPLAYWDLKLEGERYVYSND